MNKGRHVGKWERDTGRRKKARRTIETVKSVLSRYEKRKRLSKMGRRALASLAHS